jgi:hypothetical protein
MALPYQYYSNQQAPRGQQSAVASKYYNPPQSNIMGGAETPGFSLNDAVMADTNPNAGSVWGEQGLGFNKGTFSALGSGLQSLGDLAKMYYGNKALKLGEQQYRTNVDFGNRNIANQSKLINNTLEARYRAAQAANAGGGNENTESLDSYLARSKVDGSPIGGS